MTSLLRNIDPLHFQYDDSFACDHCQFSTKNKSNLKAHRNAKHLGVKYPCDKCDYKASYSNHLRQHKRVKHEGVNFPCDQCTFQTSQKSKLKLHVREKHGSSGLDNSGNVSLDNIVVSNPNNSIIHSNPNYSAALPQSHLHEDSVITTPSLHHEDGMLSAPTMQEAISGPGLQADPGIAMNSSSSIHSPSIQYLTAQLNNLVNQVNPLTPTDRDLA